MRVYLRWALIAILTVIPTERGLCQTALSRAVIVGETPVYVLPDASRTPLRTLKDGTSVNVVETHDQWFLVEFPDPLYQHRLGYVLKEHVRMLTPAPATGAQQPQKTPPATTAKGGPGSKTAGRAKRGEPRAMAWFNAGYQTISNTFSTSTTYQLYVESASFTTNYPVKGGTEFEGGGGARLTRDLAVGVTVSSYSRGMTGGIDAQVPNPLHYANEPGGPWMRTTTGDATGLTRDEIAAHVQAMIRLPLSGKIVGWAFAGPSYINVKQTLVTGLTFADTYPFDTVSISTTKVETSKKGAFGFNAGADVAYMFLPNVGVGGVVRYTRASATLATSDGTSVKVNAGGVQVGGGLRLRF